jgi:hypothetical protein
MLLSFLKSVFGLQVLPVQAGKFLVPKRLISGWMKSCTNLKSVCYHFLFGAELGISKLGKPEFGTKKMETTVLYHTDEIPGLPTSEIPTYL